MEGLIPKYEGTRQLLNQHHEKAVIFRHSHIAITDYHMGDNREFEKSLSIWDKMRWKYELLGGYYVKALKEFRVNRAFNVEQLKRFFPEYEFKVENCAYPYDDIDVELLTAPRDDIQRLTLTFMASEGKFKNNSKFTQQMIELNTGKGKAQPDDTLIPTPTGLRMLKDIDVGDYVFNRYGKPVKVLEVYPQDGKQDTYEITLKDGRKTRCNGEHLWEVWETKRKYPKIKTLNEIMKDYKNPIRYDKDGSHGGFKYAIKLPEAVKYDKQDVPIDPYVLGVFIGNGCLSEKALTLSSGNIYTPIEAAKRIGYKTHMYNKWNYSFKFISGFSYDKRGKVNNYIQTKQFFKDLPEMINCQSGDKHIPDIYKYNSKKVRKEVLRGLLDTDGSVSKDKGQISYTTVSRRLKDDIVELVRSLGYFVSVSKDKRTDKYRTGECFILHIRIPDEEKLDYFVTDYKSISKLKKLKDYKTKVHNDRVNIVKIEKVKKTHQRCILIDDSDHLYVTEDFILTHNTYMGTAITAFLKSKILVIVPLAKLLNQWKESFVNFIGIDEDDILIVKGSKICEQILEGKHTDKKVFIIMVDTIYSFAKRYGDIKTMDMLSATRCHTKIVDEVHLDLKAISMIEALSNFRMNYYMSASAGRSDGRENWIFRNLFTHIPRFGSNIETQEEKHLNVMVKKYYFTPTPKQIKRMVNNKTGLNTKAYETELRLSPEDQRLNFEQQLTVILNWTKKNLKEGNKIIVFGQSIEFLYYLQTIVEKVYPDRTSVYYGGMKKDEKEKALLSDIIIATTASLGTGADIKGLQFGINCSTYSSWISVTQISGRLRKLPDGTPTVYIEMVNFGYLKTVRQFEKRKPHLTKASRTGKLLMVN